MLVVIEASSLMISGAPVFNSFHRLYSRWDLQKPWIREETDKLCTDVRRLLSATVIVTLFCIHQIPYLPNPSNTYW